MIPDQQHNAERWVAHVLRTGIVLSSVLLIAGLILLALQDGTPGLSHHNPSPSDTFGIFSIGVQSQSPSAAVVLSSAGLLLLMSTPFVRVAATFVVFLLERDWAFAAVAAIVLFLLIGELLFAVR